MHSRNWTFIFQLTPSRRATYHFHDGGYFRDISTHALTEGDKYPLTPSSMLSLFQLTPSRRATSMRELQARKTHFNSRPHGGRRIADAPVAPYVDISTHALTEGDSQFWSCRIPFQIFQLTPSRRATVDSSHCVLGWYISTHALTEGDRPVLRIICWALLVYFNSRPHGGRRHFIAVVSPVFYFNSRPHGGRRYLNGCSFFLDIFQLTPSRRATQCVCVVPIIPDISTHALTEGDGKFRQIFLLNRGYAYSISLYFLPHFISLLPQILSFQQKSFKFQVRIFLLFSVHLAFALQNQCVHHVKSRFCTNMFYFVFVLFTQIVKPQTIGLFIYDFF